MKTHILILALTVGILSSCSPTLTPLVTKRKAPLSPNAPVIELPRSVELESGYTKVGIVAIRKVNFSSYQDSIAAIYKIKDLARRMGGNAIQFSDAKKEANVLSLSDSLLNESNSFLKEMVDKEKEQGMRLINNSISDPQQQQQQQQQKPRLLPSFALVSNVGYGFRTATFAPNLSSEQKDLLKQLRSGFVWNASAKYYFNDKYGLGFHVNTYNAKSGDYNVKDRIMFVGPAFQVRQSVLSDSKWTLDSSLGLGYIEYKSNRNNMKKPISGLLDGVITGWSVGFLADINVDYRFHENWGVGANLTAVAGTFDRFKQKTEWYETSYKMDDDTYEGLHNIQLSIGLRYYIK